MKCYMSVLTFSYTSYSLHKMSKGCPLPVQFSAILYQYTTGFTVQCRVCLLYVLWSVYTPLFPPPPPPPTSPSSCVLFPVTKLRTVYAPSQKWNIQGKRHTSLRCTCEGMGGGGGEVLGWGGGGGGLLLFCQGCLYENHTSSLWWVFPVC